MKAVRASKQLLAIQLDSVRHADVTDDPPGCVEPMAWSSTLACQRTPVSNQPRLRSSFLDPRPPHRRRALSRRPLRRIRGEFLARRVASSDDSGQRPSV